MRNHGMEQLETLYIKKVIDRVREIGERFIYSNRLPVQQVEMAETMKHLSVQEAKRLNYKPVRDGRRWGRDWGTAWFRLRIEIPPEFQGEPVHLLFDLENSECLIFRDDVPVQGLSWARKEYPLLSKAEGGERIEIFVEAGANARLGQFAVRPYRHPEIAILNREVWDAYWDLVALADMIDPKVYRDWTGKPYLTPEHDTRRAQILYVVNKAVDLFDYRDPTPDELRRQAKNVRKTLKSLYDCKARDSAQLFAAMGHAHIDVAWKWPLAETIRKCGRTFSNVLGLMEDYPEFVFVQSQPQLYAYARERYPELYKQIRRRVQKGKWIPGGCMWVEPDCHLTSGESLIRQILYGTRFFREEFGYEATTLWLPDVFGFSASLPQILKRSGIDYFFTTKLAINQFNPFPYNSFYWEGIDGSQVLTHFMPAEEYSCEIEPWVLRSGEHDHTEKDRSPIQMLPFGHGDGGGGPSRKQLERFRRYRDLDGMPRLEYMTPEQFFRTLESDSERLPRWVGELYLELHRGTYTTQALTKQYNRRAEFLLRETELVSSLNSSRKYERAQIENSWKTVLLNQFHDILPGSSIDQVHAESEQQYEQVFRDLHKIEADAFHALVKKVDTANFENPVFVFNSLSWDRTGVIELPSKGIRNNQSYVAVDSEGTEFPVQVGTDNKIRFLGTVPALGHNVFSIQKGNREAPQIKASNTRLENDRLRIEINRNGLISRIYDKKAGREVLEPGEIGNRFILFEDKMASTGTAWDIDIYYNDKPLENDGNLISTEVVEQGPIRSVVRTRRSISKSTITQDIILSAGSSRIDFVTSIEWGAEKDVLLKVAFPVNVRSTKARYDIQFGSIERPTHWNTSWDFARFEVPAHKWADLSEGNYAVALLNDCKYGYNIKDNVIRLSLLRAPKEPGKSADVNKTHEFTYAVLPHEGDFTNGPIREGYELNVGFYAENVDPAKGSIPPRFSYMNVDRENIIIETVKRAEDNDGIIVRLYETNGWRGNCLFRTSIPTQKAFETNLMEIEERELTLENGVIRLYFEPFQIRTLKLIL